MEQKETIYDSLSLDELEKTGVQFGYRDKKKESLAFSIPKGETKQFLMSAFQIDDTPDFSEKYRQAITGSGGAEKDFDALKSSALCALLCFYKINNLVIDGVTFHQPFFEVKNLVLGSPSNMDVVLIGKKEPNNRVILFLECKFSEYLDNSVQSVSQKYFTGKGKEYYEAIRNAGLGKYCTVDGKRYHFFTERAYSQGTKQVVSHLIGLESFLNRNDGYCDRFYSPVTNDGRRELYINTYDRVIFRELLFRFNKPSFDKKMETYIELSNDVRNAISRIIPRGLEFADPITYQDVFGSPENAKEINPLVAHFYNFQIKKNGN